ncbi:MAG: DUF1801 domain-containing protein [Leptospiraceae bacterium]|nr:DUF1801 domain-containing protein [Leptospiraceae bacterium]MCP5512224.1 DUF1801 domain-containing protein [Leptospiraceae bacterium]
MKKQDYSSISDYLNSLEPERKIIIQKIHKTILNSLPKGFHSEINYNMIGYVVPHKIYPSGYHCDPKLPLPFMNLASQKNFIALYHMGIYSIKELNQWFLDEYQKQVGKKPDMGKSCIRFKPGKEIPFDLISELVKKVSPKDWIETYENTIIRK